MEEAELARIRQQFDQLVRERMPGAPIERVEVLQYGDEPEVEPGQLLARVVVAAPGEEPDRLRAFESFHDERRAAFRELRHELDKLPVRVVLQFIAGGERWAADTPAEDPAGARARRCRTRGIRPDPRHGAPRRDGPGDA